MKMTESVPMAGIGIVPFGQLDEQQKIERLLQFALRDLSAFAQAFDAKFRAALPSGESFASYRATFGDDLVACRIALERAAQHGFLSDLANLLALAPGTDPARLRALSNGDAVGLAEGVMSPGTGLADIQSLADLLTVARAVCLIKHDRRAIGTGFLVEPDLILTAAHVLVDCGAKLDGTAPPGLIERLTFTFVNKLNCSEGTWPHVVRAASNWLVAWSAPCINDQNKVLDPAQAARHLDYALIRIDGAVPGHIAPVDIKRKVLLPRGPKDDPLANHRRYFIIGHSGGSDCKYDTSQLHDIDRTAARVMHTCDSVPGMSGSPFLDGSANPLGLHEGRIVDLNSGATLYNRATLLPDILTSIKAAYQQFGTPAGSVATFLDNAGVRLDWANYGRHLAGADVQLAQRWEQALADAGVDSNGANKNAKGGMYYPIFPVRRLNDWLRDTDDPDMPRVASVTGDVGSGKSFALLVARAMLPDERIEFVSAAVSSQLPLDEMANQLAPGLEFDDAWRTADGRLRIEIVESILSHYEELAEFSRSGQLLLVVEFAKGAYWTEVQSFWLQCALLCERRERLRMLLLAAPDDLHDDLVDKGAAEPIELAGPNLKNLQAHARTLCHHAGKPNAAERAAMLMAEKWDEQGRLGRIDRRFAAVDAARIVIEVANALATEELVT